MSGITRREFGTLAISFAAATILPSTATANVTYEQALKGDEKTRIKHLEAMLIDEFQILAAPKRNPDGAAKKLFYISDKPNKKIDEEIIIALRDSLRPIGKETSAEEGLDDLKKTRINQELIRCVRTIGRTPGENINFFLVSGDAAYKQHNSDDDFKSACDYIQEYVKIWSKNLTFDGKKYNCNNIFLKSATAYVFDLLPLSAQIGNILNGVRRPAQFRIDSVKERYLTKYENCAKRCEEFEKIKEPNLREETVSTLKNVIKLVDERMSSLKDAKNQPCGYETKLNDESKKYELRKIIK